MKNKAFVSSTSAVHKGRRNGTKDNECLPGGVEVAYASARLASRAKVNGNFDDHQLLFYSADQV